MSARQKQEPGYKDPLMDAPGFKRTPVVNGSMLSACDGDSLAHDLLNRHC